MKPFIALLVVAGLSSCSADAIGGVFAPELPVSLWAVVNASKQTRTPAIKTTFTFAPEGGGQSKNVETDLDGKATVRLKAGNYVVSGTFTKYEGSGGCSTPWTWTWSQKITVSQDKTSLNLTDIDAQFSTGRIECIR